MSEQKKGYEGWAIVELLGHRRLAGYVRDVEMYGGRMLRLDIPAPAMSAELVVNAATCRPIDHLFAHGAWSATQFFGVGSVYCLTPTTAQVAIGLAKDNQPAPVQRWELPALAAPRHPCDDEDPEGDDVDMVESGDDFPY